MADSEPIPLDRWTLPAHPLVAGLAVPEPDGLARAISVANSLAEAARQAPTDAPDVDPDVIDRFGTGARNTDLVVFGGYLGGRVTNNPDDDQPDFWKVLFLDATVATWLLVPRDQIVLHDRVEDATAAYRLRDLIWVKAEAQVGRGDRSTSAEALFLTGGFTRAGGFAATVSGGTLASPNSGLLCEAITPGCCGGNTRR